MLSLLPNPADNPLSPEFYGLLWHNFGPALLPFALALGVTAALVLPARWLSFRLGAVAQPGGRNIHAVPTARLGGLALTAGFVVAAAVTVFPSGPVSSGAFPAGQVVAVLGIGALAALILVADDLKGIPARAKLGLQVGFALLAAASGIAIHFVNFGGGHVLQLGWLALPVTVIWLVGTQNTMNLLDGVDGLAAGVAAVVAAALMLAAVNRTGAEPGQEAVVLLSAALIGACVGFLFFNFHPARIFMGDSGSHFLGLALGILGIFGIAKGAVVFALVVPAMALLLPIADTGWAIVRRRRQRVSIAHPDTAHVHHQLLDFGLSQRETCLVLYFATGITSGIGLMLYGHRKILGVIVVLLVVALSTVVGQRLYELENGPRAEAVERAGATGPLLES